MQIVHQIFGVRRLCEALMNHIAKIGAYFPALLRNIDPDIDLLTGELDFGTFRMQSEPPFSRGTLLLDTTIYKLKPRLTS